MTSSLPRSFFVAHTEEPNVFVPTALCRGPWHNRSQHGGPPCALLAGILDRTANSEAAAPLLEEAAPVGPPVVHPRYTHVTVRLSFSLLRPVPLEPLRVRVEPQRLGRQVHRLRAQLETLDGKILVNADALRILRQPGPASRLPIKAWEPPSACAPLVFDFFRHPVGYHRGVVLRVAGGTWGHTPIQVWGRLAVPLVEGQVLSALETLVTLADAQSGMGVPLDPTKWTFVNPDLNVILEGDLLPGWVGFDIRSTASTTGSGIAQSALRDLHREIGRAMQTLVVVSRSPS